MEKKEEERENEIVYPSLGLNTDNLKSDKNNFYLKFLFGTVIVFITIVGLYFITSPYQNCLRDTTQGSSRTWFQCTEFSDW